MYRLIIFLLALAILFPVSVFAAPAGNHHIETIHVQPVGGWKFAVGGSYEHNRGPEEAEYSSRRLFPVELNYGLFRDFELGVRYGYGDNQERDTSAIDGSGSEGVSLFAKWRYWQNVAAVAGVVVGGEDELLPYGSDGTDYWLNIPFQIPSGPGRVIGEVGYTRKGGEAFESYFNFGFGYVFDVDRKLSLRGDIINQAKTYEGGSRSLSIIASLIYNSDRNSSFVPYLEMGLKDGSPDYALGLTYSLKFGDRGPRRQQLDEMEPGWFTEVEREKESERQQRLLIPESEVDEENFSLPQDTVPGDPEEQSEISEEDRRRSKELTSAGLDAFRKNEISEAIELFVEALRLNPYNVETRYNIATIHFHRGEYQQSAQHYKTALQLRPDDIDSRLGLGASYLQMNQKEEARRQFEKVLELNPGNQGATHWLNRIRP
ncbi:MAG: tetratricopeptide repeat protein [bacterium]